MRSAPRNISASGKPETLNIASGYTVRAIFTSLRTKDSTEGDLRTALLQASQWADSGQAWTLLADSGVTVNTTLDGAAAAGATSIPVTSATGILSGSLYAIEKALEVATVEASNSATDPVTITAALDNGFPSGSRFRAFYYLPLLATLRVIDNAFMNFYDVEIIGEVDRRALS